MTYIARKIVRNRWPNSRISTWHDLQADCLKCLGASKGELSVWQCTTDKADVSEVALALATGPQVESIQRMQIVLVDVTQMGFIPHLDSEDGETQVIDLKSRHRNLSSLKIMHLCHLALAIANSLQVQAQYHTFSESRIKTLIMDAALARRLDIGTLHKNLQDKLK